MAKRAPLRKNLITIVGMAVSIISFALGAVLLVSEFVLENRNPYSAIVTYMIVPGVISMGLGIAVLGIAREWYRRKRRKTDDKPLPVLDFNVKRTRRKTLLVLVILSVFLGVSAVATYRGFLFTESTEFCGTTCHSVMGPEYAAYQHSPHARVPCVACHIGEGADWYVHSKVSGLRQVVRTILGTYEMPIEVPVRDLRPARETCEECHWPEVFTGSVERIEWHFSSDEANTPYRYHILLKVGGQNPETGHSEGIHWHTSSQETVRYWPRDRQRLDIPWVEVEHGDGSTTVYRSSDAPEDTPPADEIRVMDCIDCHNRPSHIFRSPDEMVNRALAAGTIDRNLPGIKAFAVELLTNEHSTHDAARDAFDEAIRQEYGNRQSEGVTEELIEQAIATLDSIYRQTQFPEQGVDWSTYPNHIGHRSFPGCFRCHDEEHSADDGSAISMECSNCHDFIFQANGEAAYGPVVYESTPFEHPGYAGMHEGMLCTDCHAISSE